MHSRSPLISREFHRPSRPAGLRPLVILRRPRVISGDYYLSPTGNDNNAGTVGSPWSITALNSKQATYAGKKVFLLPGTYQYGTVGGVQTTLYSLYQAGGGNNSGAVLQVNGGSAGAPTYLASCDASGYLSPRTAIIDASNPSGGAAPTIEGDLLGQNYYLTSGPANLGYVTIDGIVVRNFTHAGITFTNLAATINGVTIQNCELYDGGNVQSNNNPGAIFLTADVRSYLIKNCKIHDCQTSSGSYFPWGFAGIMSLGGGSTAPSGTIKNCTIYKVAQPVATKDNRQQVQVSYCYLEKGNFGAVSGTSLAHGIAGYVTATGATVSCDHNIIVGDVLGYGEDTALNQGTIQYLNNIFYSAQSNLDALYAYDDTTGITIFKNNVVWSDGATPGYDGGANNAGTIWVPNLVGISASGFNFNAYGANTNGTRFAKDYVTNFNLTLATWQGAGYGFDANSTSLASTPFSSTPAQANPSSFAITGPATTAGVGGGVCGPFDGTGSVGSDF